MKDFTELNLKGIKLLEQGNYKKAIHVFELLLKEYPQRYLAAFNMGLAYSKAGLLTEAEAAFRRVLESAPKDAPSLNELGLILWRLNKPLDGIPYILKAVELAPTNEVYANNAGVLYFVTQNYEQASIYFKKSTSINPQYRDAWFNLRDTWEALNKTVEQDEADKIYHSLL